MTHYTQEFYPGQPAKPDDQGESETCTRYAVSKAVTQGLDDCTYGYKIDVDQENVTASLVNKDKDVGGRWPNVVDQESILGNLL